MSNLGIYKKLWAVMPDNLRGSSCRYIFLVCCNSILESFSIGLMVPFISMTMKGQDKFGDLLQYGDWLFYGVIGAFVLSGVGRIYILWSQDYFANRLGHEMSVNYFGEILHKNYEFHRVNNSSKQLSALTQKIYTVVYGVVLPAFNLIGSAVLIVSIIVCLAIIDVVLTVQAAGVFFAIYVLIYTVVKKSLASASVAIDRLQSEIVKVIQDSMGGIRDVIIYKLQNKYSKKHANLDRELRVFYVRNHFFGAMPRPFVEVLGFLLLLIYIKSLGGHAADASQGVAVLAGFALAAQRMLPALQQSFNSVASIRACHATFESILSVLDTENKQVDSRGDIDNQIIFERDIYLDNIGYAFDGEVIIKDVTISLKRGDIVGISGETGSGKSTLVDMIMGLISPTSGSIKVDGVILDGSNVKSWLDRVSHVPQAQYLLDDTIINNIVSTDELDIERVNELCSLLGISDFANGREKGLGMRVGERGVMLSGGQRQRIGLARALYKQGELIVLDEATNAMDKTSEIELLKRFILNSSGATILIISHNPEVFALCDYVIDVKNKSIHRA